DPNSTASGSDSVIGVVTGVRTGDLAKYVPASGRPVVMIAKGCLSAGDGGGGTFFWSGTSTLVDDGGTVIRPNSVAIIAPGRWLRIYEGPLNCAGLVRKARPLRTTNPPSRTRSTRAWHQRPVGQAEPCTYREASTSSTRA